MKPQEIAVVVIGRNEGERLKRCLRSIPQAVPVIYVDSGSSDNSVAFAISLGVTVLSLDMRIGFTAARARNAGWRQHIEPSLRRIEFVQFVDGDCVLNAAWFEKALAAIRAEPTAAAVFGRRRERFPRRSIYNRICDEEWNVPVGKVASCGGDALFRVEALQAAGGFTDNLIAGEEPDLCVRLGRLGWFIWRIDAEMTLHDANILSFRSWWQRAKRGGFAYAKHVLNHRHYSEPQWRRQLTSIIFWGFCWPAAIMITVLFCQLCEPLAGVALLAALVGSYIVQVIRIAARKHNKVGDLAFSMQYGVLMMVGKFAEFSGALRCWVGHILDRQSQLIEYKQPA